MAQITMGIIQWPKDTPVLLAKTLVWSGHPKWLFSCSLYTPAQPVSAAPTPTYMTDLPICLSQGPAIDGSSFRSQPSTMPVKGARGTWPSTGFHGDQWPTLTSTSPITGKVPPLLPLPLGPPCPVPMWASNDRMLFQDFLCTCKLALIIKPYVCLSLILGSFLSLIWASNRPGRSGRPTTSFSIQP